MESWLVPLTVGDAFCCLAGGWFALGLGLVWRELTRFLISAGLEFEGALDFRDFSISFISTSLFSSHWLHRWLSHCRIATSSAFTRHL